MNNTVFTPEQKSEIKPPNYQPSRKPVLLVFVFLVLAAILLPLLYFISVRNNLNKTLTSLQDNSVTPADSQPAASTQTPSPTPAKSLKTVIYLKDANIWSVQQDGTKLRQITRDGSVDAGIDYHSLAQNDDSEIFYVRCEKNDGTCRIISKNLDTNEELDIYTSQYRISGISSELKDEQIIVIRPDSDGTVKLYYVTDGSEKEVYKFSSSLGRGGSLDDQISIQISTDGTKILVVNTITQPNLDNDTTTIWVFDTEGNKLDTVAKGLATNASWLDNSAYLYRSEAKIYRRNITGTEEEILDIHGYDITPSSNAQLVVSWNILDNGQTQALVQALENKTVIYQKEDLGFPQLLDNDTLLAVRTVADDQSYLGFTTNGLVTIDLTSGQETVLDSSSTISKEILIIND